MFIAVIAIKNIASSPDQSTPVFNSGKNFFTEKELKALTPTFFSSSNICYFNQQLTLSSGANSWHNHFFFSFLFQPWVTFSLWHASNCTKRCISLMQMIPGFSDILGKEYRRIYAKISILSASICQSVKFFSVEIMLSKGGNLWSATEVCI